MTNLQPAAPAPEIPATPSTSKGLIGAFVSLVVAGFASMASGFAASLDKAGNVTTNTGLAAGGTVLAVGGAAGWLRHHEGSADRVISHFISIGRREAAGVEAQAKHLEAQARDKEADLLAEKVGNDTSLRDEVVHLGQEVIPALQDDVQAAHDSVATAVNETVPQLIDTATADALGKVGVNDDQLTELVDQVEERLKDRMFPAKPATGPDTAAGGGQADQTPAPAQSPPPAEAPAPAAPSA